jgi:AcrR family transcriptional regulator
MKEPKSPRRSRPPYHHGNLHAALLEAASRLVAEVGPAGFTLREVARRAGVSHNAPYRHFRDKSELLATMATQGFQELTQAMLAAAEQQPTSLERLKHSGLAYVAFALRRPEHFSVMFDAPIAELEYPECANAGHECFRTLVRFVEACQRDGKFPGEDPLLRALGAWSLVHGIAKLAIAGRLPLASDADALRFVALAIDRSLLQATQNDAAPATHPSIRMHER